MASLFDVVGESFFRPLASQFKSIYVDIEEVEVVAASFSEFIDKVINGEIKL